MFRQNKDHIFNDFNEPPMHVIEIRTDTHFTLLGLRSASSARVERDN